MPTKPRTTADIASRLLLIGQAVVDAVAASGLLVPPPADQPRRRHRRTRAEMDAARAANGPHKSKATRERERAIAHAASAARRAEDAEDADTDD